MTLADVPPEESDLDISPKRHAVKSPDRGRQPVICCFPDLHVFLDGFRAHIHQLLDDLVATLAKLIWDSFGKPADDHFVYFLIPAPYEKLGEPADDPHPFQWAGSAAVTSELLLAERTSPVADARRAQGPRPASRSRQAPRAGFGVLPLLADAIKLLLVMTAPFLRYARRHVVARRDPWERAETRSYRGVAVS